jgi:hypothetical protein
LEFVALAAKTARKKRAGSEKLGSEARATLENAGESVFVFCFEIRYLFKVIFIVRVTSNMTVVIRLLLFALLGAVIHLPLALRQAEKFFGITLTLGYQALTYIYTGPIS